MLSKSHSSAAFLVFLSIFVLTASVFAGDWPMWRYDANRSASSPQELPNKLYLQWVREYPKLEQAWEDPLNQDLMQFDRVYEPVVMGRTLFIGSNVSDRLVALDTETGKEKWAFYAEGPVRFPAVASNGKVYFTSDDGYLYCVNAERGKLIWKFQGGPSDRKVLGNSRLISTWPARGGPVLKDGIVYFAAGIWPFMGIFIYALDAETGEVVWINDGSGSMYMLQPHNSPAYAGVAPQGNFVVAGDKLLIPCGRSVPACFDRHTGEFLYYHLARYNKTGGAFVCALGDRFINYHRDIVTNMYDLSTGDILIPRFGNVPVLTEETFFCMGDSITAFDVGSIRTVEYDRKVKDRETGEIKTVKAEKWIIDREWTLNVDGRGDLIKAGRRLYAGGKNVVSAIDIPSGGGEPFVSWKVEVEGTASRIIAADDRLFVVTLEGRIYAFGGRKTRKKFHSYAAKKSSLPKSKVKEAKSILEATGMRDGYCLAYGLENGDLVEALARDSELRIIAVDPDPAKVDRFRRRFDAAGLYGKSISVQVGDPFSLQAPPYMASLTVFEDLRTVGYSKGKPFFEKIYHSLRPYGGIACLAADKDEISAVTQQIQESNLPKGQLRKSGRFLLLVREGALPGSADWTHQYGDVANTVKSDDKLVKLPLGLLWFGGSSNMDVLPRHGHGPPEQVVGGRLFIEGIDCFSARDVYTGRVLWKRTLPNLGNFGIYYDQTYKNTPLDPSYNQVHIPGANVRGTNFVVAPDKVYIVREGSCLVLDPATGATVGEIELPRDPEADRPPEWGYIGVYKDYLIAGEGFVRYTDFIEVEPKYRNNPFVIGLDISSSRNIMVMNRHTGEVLWTHGSDLGFRHNAIVAGNDKIFCIDMTPPPVSDALKRRGEEVPGTPKVLGFDIRTGEVIWSVTEKVFGTWLSYSEDHDVLIQSGRRSRDMVIGEPTEDIVTYRGKDGNLLWSSDVSYGGPLIIHGENIITDRYAYNLLTGEQKTRRDPLTGEVTPWAFSRRYGCNYSIASENLLTFRSAAAGFYDLEHDGGTGNIGGFKSGCTSNLIVADGVLNAPDYTRTCSCSYQNQSSLALVHDPGVEMWVTYFGESGEGPIKDIGINLGAPGNRRAPDGRFWIAYPMLPYIENPEKESGISADVTVNFDNGGFYTDHSSRISGEGLSWVAASGCRGISGLELDLKAAEKATYSVNLYFAEPDNRSSGKRVFDISIEGRKVLENFDIFKETGAQNRSLVKTFGGVEVADGKLNLEFAPAQPEAEEVAYLPVLCGVEVTLEKQ